jgi:hypothetical protein
VRVAVASGPTESKLEERLDLAEERQDDESVERQLAEGSGERVHASTVADECYGTMTVFRPGADLDQLRCTPIR